MTALFVVCSFPTCRRRVQDPAAQDEATVAIVQIDNHAIIVAGVAHVHHMMIVVKEEAAAIGYLMKTSLNSKYNAKR